nr:hypothetical protein [Tanacetum cinerariifolium]
MNQKYFEPNPCYNSNSSGFDQFQSSQYLVVHQPPQETNTKMLQARENLMEAIQVFLTKYDQIPLEEKCIALLRAEEKFLKLSKLWKKSKINQRLYKNFYSNLFMICNFLMKFNQSKHKKRDHNPPQFLISLDGDDNDDDYDKESIISMNTDIFEIPSSDAITTSLFVLPIKDPEDSLIMRNEELNIIPKKESDEFIKSSVEDLISIPSESKDTSGSEIVCILPSCDDFSPIDVLEEKAVTFSNPLFNSNGDFISSDDESLSDEDVPEDNVKIYSNPLFEFGDKYISNEVNPLFDEVLEDIEHKDSYDPNLDESTFLVTPLFDSNEDEYFTPGDDVEILLHHGLMMSVDSILEGRVNHEITYALKSLRVYGISD